MTGLKDFRAYTRVLAANGEAIINANGRYIVGLEANGMFEISVDDGPFARFFAGAKATLPEGETFTSVRVRDTSGAANTVVLQLGHGDFEDARANVSGTIRVVDDGDGATSFVELQTRLQAIEDLLRNTNDKRTALTDLTGASYATRVLPGTTEVVSALANVNGVIIRMAGGSSQGSASRFGIITAGGNILLSGVSGNSINEGFLARDIFIPAGNDIALTVTNGDYLLWIWYEVL